MKTQAKHGVRRAILVESVVLSVTAAFVVAAWIFDPVIGFSVLLVVLFVLPHYIVFGVLSSIGVLSNSAFLLLLITATITSAVLAAGFVVHPTVSGGQRIDSVEGGLKFWQIAAMGAAILGSLRILRSV